MGSLLLYFWHSSQLLLIAAVTLSCLRFTHVHSIPTLFLLAEKNCFSFVSLLCYIPVCCFVETTLSFFSFLLVGFCFSLRVSSWFVFQWVSSISHITHMFKG